jgi:hypothetical protein
MYHNCDRKEGQINFLESDKEKENMPWMNLVRKDGGRNLTQTSEEGKNTSCNSSKY